jgi:hypothetical protein
MFLVFLPETGFLHFDHTNNQILQGRHMTDRLVEPVEKLGPGGVAERGLGDEPRGSAAVPRSSQRV